MQKKGDYKMRFRLSNILWGIILLFAAVMLIVTQFSCFKNIGSTVSIGKLIAAVLLFALIVQCIITLHFSVLPFPVAALYFIFREPMNLPEIKIWILFLAAALVSIALGILFPKTIFYRHHGHRCCTKHGRHDHQAETEYGDAGNNPSFNINFGEVSRRLKADSLETVRLNCTFGSLEIFFDQVELNPEGAQAILACSFGSIKLFCPKNWQIIDRMNTSLGEVDIENRFTVPGETGPKLTLSGSVSLGSIEVRYI